MSGESRLVSREAATGAETRRGVGRRFSVFKDFANVWSPVILASRLSTKPLPVRFAGENLVFFRDAQGVAHALLDRCPHRGVKLSLGEVTKEGCLRCPFHAWEFAGDGTATHIPLNPDAKKERLGATGLPTREIGGVLWVYTAPGAEAPNEPTVPDGLTMDGVARTFLEVDWNADWTRAMENMLDWPHLPFVHAGTIGRDLKKRVRAGARMDIVWEDRPWGAHTTSTIDGKPQEGALDFRAPNAMHLHIPTGKRTLGLMSACVPIDDASTRMLLITARDFLRARVFDRFFHWANHRVAVEDQAVVESSSPSEVPHAGDERSVRTDEPTLKFRKLYRDQLQHSDAPLHELRPVASLVRAEGKTA